MKGVECEAILKIRHCELPKVARQSAFIPLSTQTEKTHTPTPLPGEGKNKTMLYSLRARQSAFSSVIASAARQSAFIPLSPQTHNTHTPTPLPGEGKNKTMLYSLRAWQSAFSSVIASAARQSAFIPLSTQTEKTHTLHPLPSPQMKGLERARREFRLTISVAQVIHFSPSPGERARVEVPPKVGLLACRRLGQEVTAPMLRACPRSAANGLVFRTRNSRRTYHSISGSLSLGFGGFRRGTLSAPCSPFPEKCQGGLLKKGRSDANTLSFYPGMSRRTLPASTINFKKSFGGKQCKKV